MQSIVPPIRRAARRVKKTVGAAMGSPELRSLTLWQERLERARQAFSRELELMDWREELYLGTREIQPGPSARRRAKPASTVRNIVSELIESQIDSNIPKPKVDALDPADEPRALAIERTLVADINRLPVEYINDEQERTNPIQGGSWVLVEWDNTIRTHTTVGDTALTLLHPKQVFLQPGVRDYRKSRWAVCQFAVTKDYVRERFDVDVDDELEEKPDVAVATSAMAPARETDNVTLNMAYYLNGERGVGLFAWVNDVVVADYPDYFARRGRICAECGREAAGAVCACGSDKFRTEARDYEELTQDIQLSDGTKVPAMSPVLDETGAPVLDPATGQPALQPTRIPHYRLDTLPLVLRKNVSVFGKLLGESDVDRIADMQERIKKLTTKIDEKLLKGGSYITLKHGTSFELSDQELKIIRVRSADEAAAIRVQTLQPNISYDASEIQSSHYAAKETLGITDSYMGLPDHTATSGVAKQFAAQQSAGRLESKRRMKDAAWADIYALMFKLKLAYADEPRPWAQADMQGQRVYGAFNRYDFLKRDAAGEWFYEDRFLFSVDSTGGLGANREAMWQETRMNYQTGAFGQPGSPDSLLLFWTVMETLHYPKASDIRARIQQQVQSQQQMQQMQQQMQQMQAQMQAQAQQNRPGPEGQPGLGAPQGMEEQQPGAGAQGPGAAQGPDASIGPEGAGQPVPQGAAQAGPDPAALMQILAAAQGRGGGAQPPVGGGR